jgi:GNAT superfamily N-acetyltransferase
MRSFTHAVAQKQWASIDYHKNISLIGLVQRGGHQEITSIGSYAMESDSRAEVAFVVREDYQGMGIASYLLEELEKIAKDNGFRGFTATVLRENEAMTHVFKKRYPNARIKTESGGELVFNMEFSDAVPLAQRRSSKAQN